MDNNKIGFDVNGVMAKLLHSFGLEYADNERHDRKGFIEKLGNDSLAILALVGSL
jgi:hypothetical protein